MPTVLNAVVCAVLCFTMWTFVSCTVFTAMSHLEESVKIEIELVDVLREYISTEERRLGELKRFSEVSTKATDAAFKNTDDFLANPVNGFLLIKRLHVNWRNIVNGSSKAANRNYEDLLSKLSKYREHIPNDMDLQGAARALLRLQDVYNVETQEFIDGSIKGYNTTPLAGEDCFDLGRAAYLVDDHYHADIWLRAALQQLKKESEERNVDTDQKVAKTLDYLAFSHYRAGNLRKALNLSRELLKQEPTNPRVLKNIKNYEREIERKELETLEVLEDTENMSRPPSSYLANREQYEALCRGERESPLTPVEIRELKCHYVTNGNGMLILQPAKQEVVNYDPRVVVYHDVISDKEISQIITLAKPRLHRSLVVDHATKGASNADYRISSSGWLEDHHTPLGPKLARRVSYITGLSTLSGPADRHAESWQIVNYGLGGQYEPHFDHSVDDSRLDVHLPGSRNRIATWMFYLSEVKAGGYTVFPEANCFVPPVKNGAVFWYNLRPSGESDALTRHAGCPVLIGSKWVANKWIHEMGNEFNRLCGLHRDEI